MKTTSLKSTLATATLGIALTAVLAGCGARRRARSVCGERRGDSGRGLPGGGRCF